MAAFGAVAVGMSPSGIGEQEFDSAGDCRRELCGRLVESLQQVADEVLGTSSDSLSRDGNSADRLGRMSEKSLDDGGGQGRLR